MNKSDLIRAIADKSGLSIVMVSKILDAEEQVVFEAVAKKEEIRRPGFYIISVKHVPSTTGRNPKNGEPIKIEARNKVQVRTGAALKAAANSGSGASAATKKKKK